MSPFLRLALASAAVLVLGACATTATTVASVDEPDDGRSSLYGLYLAGQSALEAGDSKAAAEYFARARDVDPEAAFIKERAFTAALLAGDVSRAAALAPAQGEGSIGGQELGVIAQAVEAMATGRGKEAYAMLSGQPAVYFGSPIPLLKPWAAAAAGRMDDALILPATNDRLVKVVAGLDQALLFERARRYPEAETAFKALMSERDSQGLAAPAYGLFLERRGRREEAVAVYDQILEANPQDGSAAAARGRALAKGKPPAAMSYREGAAQALMASAAGALRDRQPQMALVYLRLILRLAPERDDAWLMAGDVMAASGDGASAREAFGKVPPKSPRYVDARSRLAWSLHQDEDKAAALTIARETVAQVPDSDMAKLNLADLLRANERFAESAQVLDPVVEAAGDRADWRLYYMRAVARERSGRWAEAEDDLEKALALKSDQPEILNYLGYSWVNRGERVKEGMAMIQRAVDAQPEEGAYVDSLGWAHYRLGQYPKAVELLERAVSLEAGDPEINDHLGDAYWRVGRRTEAQFQWSRVLTVKPDATIRARAEAKLNSPLGPDVVVAPATVARQ